jgi:hypothetical protein
MPRLIHATARAVSLSFAVFPEAARNDLDRAAHMRASAGIKVPMAEAPRTKRLPAATSVLGQEWPPSLCAKSGHSVNGRIILAFVFIRDVSAIRPSADMGRYHFQAEP